MLPKKTVFKTSVNHSYLKYGVYKKINKDTYEITTDGRSVDTAESLIKYCNSNKVSLVEAKSDLIEYYNEYKQDIKYFEKRTGFNFARGQYKIKKMAFYIWNLVRDQSFTFGESTSEEQDMIFKANRSGLRYKKKGLYNNMIKLDVNKHYSSILRSVHHSLPKGKPIKKTITQDEIDRYYKFPYGLYNCKIEGDLRGHLFMENKNNI